MEVRSLIEERGNETRPSPCRAAEGRFLPARPDDSGFMLSRPDFHTAHLNLSILRSAF